MKSSSPNTLYRLLGLSSLISLLIVNAACAEHPMSNANPNPKAEVKADIQAGSKAAAAARSEPASLGLWRQIQAEIGDAACDGPQQCHSIAIGAKSCGGPDSYMAWSSKHTDGQKLRSLVEQHAAARKAENQASDMRSDCRVVTDPGARCVPSPKGQGMVCALNERGSGGGSAI
ncbi:hypothetical protein LNV09_05860 [Paucibacter sp. B2R-40]|uniref:hypothetical protein n=1 Tax=Paucibacter sp. B2R-40 TaxID=2893554 RepID=UPI0021E4C03C|nr:hypothetical protein [Paucibacter sp. B2R-40]MCV2353686.1 hypothetical protein [Paucibacter sp. B2R-40]